MDLEWKKWFEEFCKQLFQGASMYSFHLGPFFPMFSFKGREGNTDQTQRKKGEPNEELNGLNGLRKDSMDVSWMVKDTDR